MEKIKGLILKDLLSLKVYKKNIITSCIIYALLIITQAKNGDMESLGTIMFILIFSMMSLSTFNYDEKSLSDRYILTFPLTKKEVVLSKYILCFSAIIFGALVGSIISSILVFMVTNNPPNIVNIIYSILGGMVGLSFMQSVQIPCIYKWGAEKGRNQIYLIFIAIFVVLTGLLMVVPEGSVDFSVLDKISNIFPIFAVLTTAILYIISYTISYKIYCKKEV